MARKLRTFKLVVKNIEDGKIWNMIMGDNYKDFEDHFVNFCDAYTKKWHYESEDKYAKCLGRTMELEFIDLFIADARFVGFGGLKWTCEERYNSELQKHNENAKRTKGYKLCPKKIEDIKFEPIRELLSKLIKDNRIITQGELNRLKVTTKPLE